MKEKGPRAVPQSPLTSRVCGGFTAALVFVLCLFRIQDPDTWFHIKVGEWILENGIPRTDPFSYVIAGKPWVAFEWLSQVLFHALFGMGSAGLILFKALVIAGAFAALWRLNAGRPLWSAVVVCCAALGAQVGFTERPFLFDYLFLAVMLSMFWDLKFREPPKHLRWTLPLLTAAWVNLHGGAALLAPLLTAAGAAAEFQRDRKVPVKFWASVVGLSLAALMINPWGPKIVTHLWATLTFPSKWVIREWQPPARMLFGFYGAFLLAAAFTAKPLFFKRPFAAVWLVGSAVASLLMQRNAPLFIMIAAPAAASVWAPRLLLGQASRLTGPLLAALGLAAWAHTTYACPHLTGRFGLGAKNPMDGAVAFVEREGVHGRMFNEYGTGGYIIHLAYPRKVFIDGRSLEYGPRLVRLAIGWYRPSMWKLLDKEHDFAYAVVRHNTPDVYRTLVLDTRPEWRLVYWDDDASVYLKDTPANAKLIEKHAFELIKPGRGSFQYLELYFRDRKTAGKLSEELRRSLAQAPESGNALLMNAYFLVRQGRGEEALPLMERAVALHPERASARFMLGWLQVGRGELRSAEDHYREALRRVTRAEKSTLGADILNNLGRVKELKGDPAAAKRLYRKALRWNPKQGDARHNLGRLGKG